MATNDPPAANDAPAADGLPACEPIGQRLAAGLPSGGILSIAAKLDGLGTLCVIPDAIVSL